MRTRHGFRQLGYMKELGGGMVALPGSFGERPRQAADRKG